MLDGFFDFMSEIGSIMLAFIILAVVITYGLLVGFEQMSLPGNLARIEQLRADVERTDAANSEDVIGQVTAWNQKIASYRAYNQTWVFALIVPDEYDSVELIEIPRR